LTYVPQALKQEPRPLDSFYGPMRAFSFPKEIQPILDAKCVSCHNSTTPNGINLQGTPVWDDVRAWNQSYLNLTSAAVNANKYLSWLNAEDSPLLQPPYRVGACKSPLITLLAAGHHNVTMTKEEMDRIRCWIDLGIPHCGEYTEGMRPADKAATDAQYVLRRAWEAQEQADIKAMISAIGPGGIGRHPGRAGSAAGFSIVRASINQASGAMVIRVWIPASMTNVSPDAVLGVAVYAGNGRLVRSASFNLLTSGYNSVVIDSRYSRDRALSAGMYVCKVSSAGTERTVRLVQTGRGYRRPQ
jgi:hypothetical protein